MACRDIFRIDDQCPRPWVIQVRISAYLNIVTSTAIQTLLIRNDGDTLINHQRVPQGLTQLYFNGHTWCQENGVELPTEPPFDPSWMASYETALAVARQARG